MMIKRWVYSLELLYTGFIFTAALRLITVELYKAAPCRASSMLYKLVHWYSVDFWLFCGLWVASQVFLLLCPQSTGDQTRVIRPAVHFVRFTMVLLSNILFSSVFWWCLLFFAFRESYWAFCAFAFLAGNWLLWLWVFHRLRVSNSGNPIVQWIGNRLNKGTALQFFVQEIQAAFGGQRENSPTNSASVLGVATGSAVMALIYGPGISFLFSNHGKSPSVHS